MYIIAIDVGGTFTDSVAIDDKGTVFHSARFIGKSSTRPRAIEDGVMDSLDDLASQIGISTREMLRQAKFIGHGTTVGTNALITKTGAKVGLITTKGFEDTIYIQRAVGRLAGLTEEEIKHQVVVRQPKPLVSKRNIVGVAERIDCFGNVVIPIDIEEIRRAVNELLGAKVESLAVCLLWSFMNPIHEKAVEDVIRELAPNMPVSLSYKLAPKIRENARSNTVAINAYVDRIVKDYLGKLNVRLNEQGFQHNMAAMQVFGGVTECTLVDSIHTIDSGPVGGVIGGRFFADLLGYENVITTDMGGTSFDVSVLHKGREIMAREFFGAAGVIARFETLVPRVDIKCIGAGGGTIAWVDKATKALKLGPMSAGADPGPVFYDKGGTEPTVADACMVLGYLNPDYFLNGRIKTNKEKSVEAIREKLAVPLGMDVPEAAAGVFDIVNNHMADAIRGSAVEKGYNPAEFIVFAFGGASPLHAAAYGEIVGAQKTVIMEMATAFSAFGIAMADIVHKKSTSLIMHEPFDAEIINQNFAALEEAVREEFAREGLKTTDIVIEHSVDIKYRGQIHELTVPLPRKKWTDSDITEEISKIFTKRYEEVYGEGAAYTNSGIELVAQNVDGVGKLSKPRFEAEPLAGPNPEAALKGYRDAYFRKFGGYVSTPIYDDSKLLPGNVLEGPAIVETPQTTILILPGQRGSVDGYRNIVVDHRNTSESR